MPNGLGGNITDADMDILSVPFVDYFVSVLDECTWLPDIWKRLSAYVCMSTVVGRSAYAELSVKVYYPNMYVLLVGPTRCGKGTAIDDITYFILSAVDRSIVLPKTFTGPGLLTALAAHPSGVVCNDEIASIIGTKLKYMEGLKTLLIQLYNCPPMFTQGLKQNNVTVYKPYLTLYLGSQLEILSSVLDAEGISSGFLPRFLISYSDYMAPKNVKSLSQVFRRIVRIVAYLKAVREFLDKNTIVIPIRESMVLEIDAFRKWLDTLSTGVSHHEQAYLANSHEQVIKMTLLDVIDTALKTCPEFRTDLEQMYINKLNNILSNTSNVSVLSIVSDVSDGIVWSSKELKELIRVLDTMDTMAGMPQVTGAAQNAPSKKSWIFNGPSSDLVLKRAFGHNAEVYKRQILEGALLCVRGSEGTMFEKRVSKVERALFEVQTQSFPDSGAVFISKRDLQKKTGLNTRDLEEIVGVLKERDLIGNIRKEKGKIGAPKTLYELHKHDTSDASSGSKTQ